MISSAVYHLYNAMGRDYYIKLLKLDLIGIGILIFTVSIVGIYVGFHNYEKLGLTCIGVVVICMVVNMGL